MKRCALFLLLCAGCSILDGHRSRPFAEWKVHGSVRPAGACATIEPWIVKSGAEGVAFVLEAQGRASCTFVLTLLEMRLADETLHREIATAPAAMMTGGVLRIFVPLPFDNRAAWNRGSRTATLVVRGTIDGAPFESGPWTLDHTVTQ